MLQKWGSLNRIPTTRSSILLMSWINTNSNYVPRSSLSITSCYIYDAITTDNHAKTKSESIYILKETHLETKKCTNKVLLTYEVMQIIHGVIQSIENVESIQAMVLLCKNGLYRINLENIT